MLVEVSKIYKLHINNYCIILANIFIEKVFKASTPILWKEVHQNLSNLHEGFLFLQFNVLNTYILLFVFNHYGINRAF